MSHYFLDIWHLSFPSPDTHTILLRRGGDDIEGIISMKNIYPCLDKGLADPVGGAGDERPVAQLLHLQPAPHQGGQVAQHLDGSVHRAQESHVVKGRHSPLPL